MAREGGYGDYMGGPDAPFAFPIYNVRYWEAIQSTTRSWGYNQNVEDSRKAPHILMRMLVDIVSKNGNFMLNFSPLGNGAFPQGDLDTLAYFAGWADGQIESIHGAGQNPIALQNWGKITYNDSTNALYLHVFEWPENGIVNVSGLATPVTEATLLKGQQALPTRAVGEDILAVQVPKSPPHAENSVIKLTLDGKPTGDGRRRIDPETVNRIHVYDTKLFGGSARPANGKHSRAYLKDFRDKGASVTWKLRADRAATYDVHVVYDNPNTTQLLGYDLRIGSQMLRGTTNAKGTGDIRYSQMERQSMSYKVLDFDAPSEESEEGVRKSVGFVSDHLGTIRLEAGAHDMILATPKNAGRHRYFRPRAVFLTPVP